MKRWAYITVGLYALLLLLLTIPVGLLCFHEWLMKADGKTVWSLDFKIKEAAELFQAWGYWLWLGVLVTAQALLLLVPVAAVERRPAARRRLFVPVVVASFLLANLLLAGIFSVLVAIMGDKALESLEVPAKHAIELIQSIPELGAALASLGLTPDESWLMLSQLVGLVLIFWLIWGLMFLKFTKSDNAETLSHRATRWLLRGSILELLIAVPCHVIVRHRNECCAPMVSFWGIVTGLSVMLLSFGPGVLFLFAARLRKKRPHPAPPVLAEE